jgi:hypothetical protein
LHVILTVNNNTSCFATIDKVFETCREYISYLLKTLSIVAKQKVLLFTVNITRNRMQNPIINYCSFQRVGPDPIKEHADHTHD